MMNNLKLFGLVLILLAGCTTKPAPETEQQIAIVTTTGMIADAARNVAGELASVTELIGPGVDPHLYKASQGDLEKLTGADVVFYNGLHLEGKMGEVLEKLGKRKPVVAVAANIPDSLLRTAPGFAGAHDPHIWFDVILWKHAVQAVGDFLSKQYPAQDSTFQSNTTRYLSRLDSLDAAIRARVHEIPAQQRVLITAHDAFGYFGQAYGMEVRGLQGISTLSEFGLRDVTAMVQFIIERKIKAIFVESSVSPRSIQAVVEGCKKKGWEVRIAASLYSDAMGAAGTPEGTYTGMVMANVNNITEALK
ncbi:MAG: metal ABC transporter solute-binding protein, Zn/Mn family [Bacteroidota bacterium]